MLNIGNRNFMNLQEAVGWLLENNALPFQSTANYAGNTEIAMSTLINPSPAKVRVGSIIFFADSKVSTVIGVTSNSFIVSDQYNDLVDDIVYVSNVAINASGHLIVTLSNGTDIDAGLIKQVASFSIDGSQHLIATYNDGSTNDLGAIFNGNLNISGNIVATGYIEQKSANWTHDVSFVAGTLPTDVSFTKGFCEIAHINGELHFIFHGKLTNSGGSSQTVFYLGSSEDLLPSAVAEKIYDMEGNNLHQHVDTTVLITAGTCTVCSSLSNINSAFGTINFGLFHSSNLIDRISFVVALSSGLAIPAGETRYLSCRVCLTLV